MMTTDEIVLMESLGELARSGDTKRLLLLLKIAYAHFSEKQKSNFMEDVRVHRLIVEEKEKVFNKSSMAFDKVG
jgi:hypothetical protein